jgi:hypothetical protein
MRSCLFAVSFLIACSPSGKHVDHTTDISTAKGFIQSMFRGEFDKAELYIIADHSGSECMNKYRFTYNQFITKERKEKYKTASVIIEKEVVNDSTTIIKYKDPVANTSPTPLKLIRKNNSWLIDFSYSCSGNL